MRSIIIFSTFVSSTIYADNANWFPIQSPDDIGTSETILEMTPSTSVGNYPSAIQKIIDKGKGVNSPINNNFVKNHNIVKEYYERGAIKKSTSYKGKLKDGVETEYYTNGTVMMKTYYLNGVKHGVETIYDEAGKVYKKTFYRDGIKQD